MLRGIWLKLLATLRRDFVAGLLVLVPIMLTIAVTVWGVQKLDNLVLPKIFELAGSENSPPPFLGLATLLMALLLTGALTRSFIGRVPLGIWERLIERVPVAGWFYSTAKHFMNLVFGGDGKQAFSRVVIVEYPRRGIYTYAFVTGRAEPPPAGLPHGLIKVFVPSTPNPTTGYYLLLPEAETHATGLTVEQATKLIITAGVVDGHGSLPSMPGAPTPIPTQEIEASPSTDG